jgi:hypothetical protein
MNKIELFKKAKKIYEKHTKLSGSELGKKYALKSADTCKKLAPFEKQNDWEYIITEIQKM